MFYAIEKQKKEHKLFARWYTVDTLYIGTLEDCFKVYNHAVAGFNLNNQYFRVVLVKRKIK